MSRQKYRRNAYPISLATSHSDKRLLLLSPFDPKERRLTKTLAETRNSFVATVASSILVAHASTNGTTYKLVTGLLASGRRILTLDLPDNEPLIQNGVQGVPISELPSFVGFLNQSHALERQSQSPGSPEVALRPQAKPNS